MKTHHRIILISIVASVVSACAITVPKEMKLADPVNRKTVDKPGKNVDAMRRACAETMLNASPASEAKDIVARVLSAPEPTIIEVDATLLNVGLLSKSVPITYHCEYQQGTMTLGTWTRGLKGGSN